MALAMRRSVDLLVGMYAVAKAGGAYVPVDPDQPAERTNYILSARLHRWRLTTARDEFAVPEGVGSGIVVVRLDTARPRRVLRLDRSRMPNGLRRCGRRTRRT